MPLQYGNNVRSPSLKMGTKYVMKTWGREATYDEVTFNGFESGGTTHDTPNKRIKDMLPTDLYHFTKKVDKADVKFTAKMSDNCIVLANADRITFFETLANSTALTPKSAATPSTPKAEKVAKPEKTPKQTATAPAPTDTETPEAKAERLRVERNERKRAARAAARKVGGKTDETAVAPAADEPIPELDEAVDAAVEAGVESVLADAAEIEAEAEAEPIEASDEAEHEEPGNEPAAEIEHNVMTSPSADAAASHAE